jgi:hypothetical protein
VVHVVAVLWLHTLTLAQLPPGLGQTAPVYWHWPTATQSALLAQAVPVAEQVLLWVGQGVFWSQLAVVVVQEMLPSAVWVAVAVWVPVTL